MAAYNMYNRILEKFIERGFSEETASRLAEIIYDWGWSKIRDILNEIEED